MPDCAKIADTPAEQLTGALANLYGYAETVATGKEALASLLNFQCIAAEYLRRKDSCSQSHNVAVMSEEIKLLRDRVKEIANPQGLPRIAEIVAEERTAEVKRRLLAALAEIAPGCGKVTVARETQQSETPVSEETREGETQETSGLPDRCRSEARIRGSEDSDVKRLADEIISARLCYTVETVEEGGRTWVFQLFENIANPDGPAWYLPHDNENSAFNAAIRMVVKHGGKVLAVETGDNRLLGSADPNRFFGTDPAFTRSCQSLGGGTTPQYTGKVMAAFEGSRYPILTMHNNTNEGGVRLNVNTSKEQGHPPRGSAISADIDDFIYYSSPKPYAQNEQGRAVVAALNQLGIGVVYEFVNIANNDCSLSNHAALIGKEYFNIEAQHGHTEIQVRIADKLVEYLQTR